MAYDDDTHNVASSAAKAGMVRAGWAWIILARRSPVRQMQGWLFVRPVLLSEGMPAFAEQVKAYTGSLFAVTSTPCQDRNDTSSFGTTCEEPLAYLTFSVALHNAVMLYAHAAAELLSEGGDLRNGREVASKILNTSFEGMGRSIVQLDSNGDRIESYEFVNYVKKADGQLQSVSVGVYSTLLEQYTPSRQGIVWPGGINQVPRDEDCQSCRPGEFSMIQLMAVLIGIVCKVTAIRTVSLVPRGNMRCKALRDVEIAVLECFLTGTRVGLVSRAAHSQENTSLMLDRQRV